MMRLSSASRVILMMMKTTITKDTITHMLTRPLNRNSNNMDTATLMMTTGTLTIN